MPLVCYVASRSVTRIVAATAARGECHALYKSDIVTGIEFDASAYGTIEQVESGEVLGLSYGDSQQMIRFPIFTAHFTMKCWRSTWPIACAGHTSAIPASMILAIFITFAIISRKTGI
jgi:hypothetical protein